MTGKVACVRAAGALVWRERNGAIEVALVHRPRYDDWSWPKGKLDRGEDFVEAAVREVFEETGFFVALGISLPGVEHDLSDGSRKVVKYWAARVIGGDGELVNEIDAVEWLTIPQAYERLSYARDHDPLMALEAAHERGELDTWPLLIVRHAHAVSRAAYRGSKDWHRPLSERGVVRAKAMVPTLGAWGVARLVSSSSTRCVQTLTPFAQTVEIKMQTTQTLSEECFEKHPRKALKTLHAEIKRGMPVALCTHRPLIPALADELATFTIKGSPARRILSGIKTHGMDKGEILVCHIKSKGDSRHIISVERLRTPLKQR